MEITAEVGFARFFTSMGHEEAVKFYDGEIARVRELGDKGIESQILSVKGLYLCGLGHLREGHEIIEEANAIARLAGDPRVETLTVSVLGFAERWLGRPARAVELTEGLSDRLNEMYNPSQFSALMYFRGLSLAEMGRTEDAISTLSQGIDLCEKLGSLIHLGRFYNTVGYCYGEIHHPEEAWKWNLKSEEIARGLMEQYPMRGLIAGEIVAMANVNLMENLFDQGRKEEAWNRIEPFRKDSTGPNYDRSR